MNALSSQAGAFRNTLLNETIDFTTFLVASSGWPATLSPRFNPTLPIPFSESQLLYLIYSHSITNDTFLRHSSPKYA